MQADHFQERLLNWFDQFGRKNLPWQQDINPYRVWLSEIMLQQTQVSSVIPYFNNFISRFPNVESLAAAELDEVLHYWSGLGYYARARNLHKTAQLIAENKGIFPDTVATLSALPGIGLSTAGAILSISMAKSEPILDGNVRRVLTRFHAILEWPGEKKITDRLWEISRQYTPHYRVAAYTQAIMDLGATLCTRRKPNCTNCPIAIGCKGFALGIAETLPKAKPSNPLPVKQVYFLILQNSDAEILLQKRPPTGIWGGLWSLPEFDKISELTIWLENQNFVTSQPVNLTSQRHTFSHYHLDYTPILVNLLNPTYNVMEANQTVWYKLNKPEALGLPAPIKCLLEQNNKLKEVKHVKNS